MTANCLCGGIQIEIAGKLGPVVYCHCSRCQKANGTAFAANADVRRKYWRLRSGEDLVREFPSSPGVRAFCSRCGSPIYSRRDAEPDSLRLRLGILNDDPGRRPLAHFWVGSKAAWFAITDGLPQFAAGPAEHADEAAARPGGSDLPDLAAVLGPLLLRVSPAEQPLLIALAERLAAARYREWSRKVAPEHASGLLACAEREEEIARRVEALSPAAAAAQRDLLVGNPDLIELNRSLFSRLSLADQLALQARGERLGAATWRGFAERATDAHAREVFHGCARLEEESAAFLESLAKR